MSWIQTLSGEQYFVEPFEKFCHISHYFLLLLYVFGKHLDYVHMLWHLLHHHCLRLSIFVLRICLVSYLSKHKLGINVYDTLRFCCGSLCSFRHTISMRSIENLPWLSTSSLRNEASTTKHCSSCFEGHDIKYSTCSCHHLACWRSWYLLVQVQSQKGQPATCLWRKPAPMLAVWSSILRLIMTGRCRSGRMILSMLAPLELDILQAGYAMTDNSEVSAACLLP